MLSFNFNCHKIKTQHNIWDKMMYKITIFGKNEILTFFPEGQNGSIWVWSRKKSCPQKPARNISGYHRKGPTNSLKS